MTIHATRRALLAGAASLSALALPAGAMQKPKPHKPSGEEGLPQVATLASDPIFAAIEGHRAAFLRRCETGRDTMRMLNSDPGADVALKAEDAAIAVCADAEDALCDTMPTTRAGALALLRYVDDFNAGAVKLPAAPDQWRSSSDMWPEDFREDDARLDQGMPYEAWILRNVRRALEKIEAQS